MVTLAKLLPGEKIQGKAKLAKYLEDNPEEYDNFRKEVLTMVGMYNED